MQAVQGVASTVQGAYIDFRTPHEAKLSHARYNSRKTAEMRARQGKRGFADGSVH